MRTRRLLAPALLGGVLLLGLAACDFGLSVSASEVERQITDKLGPQIGGSLGADCPGNLPGEVGARITCTLVASDGSSRPVHVTVTSVEGDQVNFDMQAPPVTQ